MTICVAIKVHDCLVFAADSATSLVGSDDQGQPTIFNVMAHGNKVFNLVKGLPICAMTCGMGNIGRASISTLAKDLRKRLGSGVEQGGVDSDKYSIQDIGLPEKPNGHHSLEFFIGGYSTGCEQAEVWKIIIANGECPDPVCQLSPDTSATVL
jgi:hypothetical protein